MLRARGHREILNFECAYLKFMVSGPSKQAQVVTHARAQCSHASVGLTQARQGKSGWITSSLVPSLCMPSSKKQSCEQSQISLASSQKV